LKESSRMKRIMDKDWRQKEIGKKNSRMKTRRQML
jgi:hypothetical protein